jgi:hypothetical protein
LKEQGFSSENWEEALAFQIGKFMCGNFLLWEKNSLEDGF